MKTSGLSTWAWLLAVAGVSTFLIGAFAHFDPSAASRGVPSAAALAAANEADAPASAQPPALPADLSPGLAEIVRLAQAHVDEGVILAYIQNSGQAYAPSAEEILYLSDLGLPQYVIAALFKADAAGTAADATGVATAGIPATEPSPPGTTADSGFFYNQLAPYGSWQETPDYGLSWQPTAETIDPDWTPYVDRGEWVDSDGGWYWQSDYTWGWAAFHYGRWVRTARLGWVWVPDSVWASAWVAWRSTGSCYGWAPLPPGASLNARGAANTIPASSFVFVNAEDFRSRNLRKRAVPVARAAALFAQSEAVENYSSVNGNIINGGISRAAVAAATHKTVAPVALLAVSSRDVVARVSNRATLGVYRPDAPAVTEAAPVTTPAERSPGRSLLADASFPQPVILPSGSAPGQTVMPLPPLRYGAPPPAGVKPLASVDNAESPRPVGHRREGRLDPVARPTAAPPAFEAPPAGEAHREGGERRYAQPEQGRAFNSPRAASANGSSHSSAATH